MLTAVLLYNSVCLLLYGVYIVCLLLYGVSQQLFTIINLHVRLHCERFPQIYSRLDFTFTTNATVGPYKEVLLF